MQFKFINKINFKFMYMFMFILVCALILMVSLRGLPGNPTVAQLNSTAWKEDGPFELSPERGRYALTYSIIETGSVYLPGEIARFASPDVGTANGKYVSIFAPLVSYLIIPGYLLGKMFNVSQVGSFAVVSIFAILNVILLRSIAIRLGADKLAATAGSLVFIFGTPAFAYAVNLYQHHLSTFLMLFGIYALLRFKELWALLLVFFIFGCAVPLDYPNLFFLFPIALYAGLKVFSFEKIRSKLAVKINIFKILTPFIVLLPMAFFLWFNAASYGNPFQLSGTVKAVNFNNKSLSDITLEQTTGKKEDESHGRSAVGFFKTRDLLNGFYIHFISPDRGIIYYAPVVLFGIVGLFIAVRKKITLVPVLLAIIGTNIILYSMWGDPWGGWAFGSRYLIPTYAILSIFVALSLTYLRKKIWFMSVFILVAFYSIAVNTLGAITTSALPPQVQVLELEKISGIVQRYTYQRNWEFLLNGESKSFVYREFLSNYISSVQFYALLTSIIFIILGGIMIYYVITVRRGVENV